MAALRRFAAMFLALLLFTGQSGYSLTLCYCAKDGHVHFEWPWQNGDCCTGETTGNATDGTCSSPKAGAACCALKESLVSLPCCTHTTLVIKKTDPATASSIKKSFSIVQEWAKFLKSEEFTLKTSLSILATSALPPHIFDSSGLSSENAQARLCVWRN